MDEDDFDDPWIHEEGGDTHYVEGVVPKLYRPYQGAGHKRISQNLSELKDHSDYRGVTLKNFLSLFQRFEGTNEYEPFFNSIPDWVEILDLSINHFDSSLLRCCQSLLERTNFRFLVAVHSFKDSVPTIVKELGWVARNFVSKIIYVEEDYLDRGRMPSAVYDAHLEYCSLENKYLVTNYGRKLIRASKFESEELQKEVENEMKLAGNVVNVNGVNIQLVPKTEYELTEFQLNCMRQYISDRDRAFSSAAVKKKSCCEIAGGAGPLSTPVSSKPEQNQPSPTKVMTLNSGSSPGGERSSHSRLKNNSTEKAVSFKETTKAVVLSLMNCDFGGVDEEAVLQAIAGLSVGDDDPLLIAVPQDRLGQVNLEANAPNTAAANATRKHDNWNLIRAELTANGAHDVMGLGVVFRFLSWQAKADAYQAMARAIPWAFFAGPALQAICPQIVPTPPTVLAGFVTFYDSIGNVKKIDVSDENFFEV